MARIRLDLPESFPFSTELVVRVSDINYGGHLGNDAVLSLVQEARIRFLEQFGYTELNVEGRGIIMTDSAVVYKAQAFRSDRLRIDVAASEFTRKGCNLFYRLVMLPDETVVAEAKTGIVFFDYDLEKVVDVPEEFRKSVEP